MRTHRPTLRLASLCLLAFAASAPTGLAQTKCLPTGGIGGIRANDQLLEFSGEVCAVKPDWKEVIHNRQFPREPGASFTRDGATHTAHLPLEKLPLHYSTTVTDKGAGKAEIDVSVEESAAIPLAGVYYRIAFPADTFADAKLEWIDAGSSSSQAPQTPVKARGLRVVASHARLEIAGPSALELLVRPGSAEAAPEHGAPLAEAVYVKISDGTLAPGQSAKQRFTLTASVDADVAPVTLALDTSHPGRPFDGIGGNFRLQFPDRDPQVVDYCLKNLRVSWGRIAMWWRSWQPDENVDPVAQADAGTLDANLYRQMKLAQRLAAQHIPVIVSIWFPPQWAGETRTVNHRRTVTLDESKADAICTSIGKYLLYLKSHYGVEATLFSFNEPDHGVSVLTDPAEHAFWAEHLGRHFAKLGLSTKFLLGDTAMGTADATRLIKPAFDNPALQRYVGAIAFHTYGGCSDEDLAAWQAAADAVHLPLLVTEASLDGWAHLYPSMFTEDWFQLYEANLMTDICGKTQTSLMMVWQLTADYSPLAGGGIYGDNGPLRPTMRYWFLKQLGSTPAGAFHLSVHADRPRLSCAAYGDIANGHYAIHVVNTGATRAATLTGLPADVKELRVYHTDMHRGMEEGPRVPVTNGVAHVTLDTATFTSFFATR